MGHRNCRKQLCFQIVSYNVSIPTQYQQAEYKIHLASPCALVANHYFAPF